LHSAISRDAFRGFWKLLDVDANDWNQFHLDRRNGIRLSVATKFPLLSELADIEIGNIDFSADQVDELRVEIDEVQGTGTYRKLVPHGLLVFTWNLSWDDSGETLVTVAFRDVEGGTEVRLTHERFATEALRDQHETGWTSVLASLDRYASAN
jgi:hypothetical protein